MGFIAQDVKSAFIKAGVTNNFAVYSEWIENGKETCGLSYIDFIPLNTWQIQKLKSRVSELEKEIENLKSR